MISFIMPSYNRKDRILQSVQAICDQTTDKWELIICESGKGEGHEEIGDLIESHKNITYVHRKDSGITDAVNYGMKLSRGELIMWANDDDILYPDTAERVLDAYTKAEPKKMWGFGKIRLSDGGEMGHDGNFDQLRKGNFVPQPSAFWSRKAYEQIGEMSRDFDLASDYEYWLRLMKNFPEHIFINDHVAFYKMHPDQATLKSGGLQLKQTQEIQRLYS